MVPSKESSEDHYVIQRHKRRDKLPKAMRQASNYGNGYILFSLSLFLVFQSSSADVSGTNNIDHIKLSNCSVPLTHCPKDSRAVKFREQCIHHFKRDSCPEGFSYLCGVVGRYIVEMCARNKECVPGTTYQFTVDGENRKITLECIPCPEGWFEPEFTNSSRSSVLPGCTYRHKPSSSISSNLVLYQNGTRSSPTKWYCDIMRGFYERGGKMFCDDVPTQRCYCVSKTCPMHHLLRPDGVCVRCNTRLDPERWFNCVTQTSMYRNKSLPLTEIIPSTTIPNTTRTGNSSQNQTEVILSSQSVTTLDSLDSDNYQGSTEAGEENAAVWIVIALGTVSIPICLFLIIIVLDWLSHNRLRVKLALSWLCDWYSRNQQRAQFDSQENPSTPLRDGINGNACPPSDCKFRIENSENCQIGNSVFNTLDNSQHLTNYNFHTYNYMCNNGNPHSCEQHASPSSANGDSTENNSLIGGHRMNNLKSFPTSSKEESRENESTDYLSSQRTQGSRNRDPEETQPKEVY